MILHNPSIGRSVWAGLVGKGGVPPSKLLLLLLMWFINYVIIFQSKIFLIICFLFASSFESHVSSHSTSRTSSCEWPQQALKKKWVNRKFKFLIIPLGLLLKVILKSFQVGEREGWVWMAGAENSWNFSHCSFSDGMRLKSTKSRSTSVLLDKLTALDCTGHGHCCEKLQLC